jgi:hypothetical protein
MKIVSLIALLPVSFASLIAGELSRVSIGQKSTPEQAIGA